MSENHEMTEVWVRAHRYDDLSPNSTGEVLVRPVTSWQASALWVKPEDIVSGIAEARKRVADRG